MEISEIFCSVQGEGPNVGKKAIFVRIAGCNLRCKFCDTKYAYKGKELTTNEVITKIKNFSCKSIIWTGGEPTLQIKEICKIIKKLENYHHDIETNGTCYFPISFFDTIIISPKKQAINAMLIKKYKKVDNVYFKFVVENKKNYEFWKNLIEKLNIKKKKIYFVPEARTKKVLIKKSKWLVPQVEKDGFNFSSRLQVLKNFK